LEEGGLRLRDLGSGHPEERGERGRIRAQSGRQVEIVVDLMSRGRRLGWPFAGAVDSANLTDRAFAHFKVLGPKRDRLGQPPVAPVLGIAHALGDAPQPAFER